MAVIFPRNMGWHLAKHRLDKNQRWFSLFHLQYIIHRLVHEWQKSIMNHSHARFFKNLRLSVPFAILIFLFQAGSQTIQAALPAGWSDADIGSPGLAGSASEASGDWTVTGGGADIWNAADQF